MTATDEAYRRLLLEGQGYEVELADFEAARTKVHSHSFHLTVVTTDRGLEAALKVCRAIKEELPVHPVVLVAPCADSLPDPSCVDAVVRDQYRPARLVNAVRNLLNKKAEGQSG